MKHFIYKGDERRTFIRELFRSWHDILKKYEQVWGETGDLEYVYKNQAQVGLFSMAAAKAGGLPFLEFSARRYNGAGEYVGKGDLHILLKKGKREIWIEAESVQVSFEDEGRFLATFIREPLKEVVDSVHALRERLGPALALVFIRPYGAKREGFDPKPFQEHIYEAANILKADFCAIHLCHYDIWSRGYQNDCPGIAVIGKYIERVKTEIERLNFSWVIEDKLAGHSVPISRDDLAHLKNKGVQVLIRMTEDFKSHMSQAQIQEAGLIDIHEPVPDFMAPKKSQIERLVNHITESISAGKPVAVSCNAGIGRTGTILACYLVANGLTPEEAFEEIKRTRGSCVLTPDQKEAVYDYWKRVRRQHHHSA